MVKLAVVDIETTGTKGLLYGDHIVDVGITVYDTKTDSVRPLFGSVVGYDTSDWDEEHKNAWVFSHTDLTLEDVEKAPKMEDVAFHLRFLLGGYYMTSFNMKFDFDRFLDHDPWGLKHYLKAPDIMLAADRIYDIPRSKIDLSSGWRSYPTVENTYKYLFGESDPANIQNCQTHRALSDTIVEAHILRELYKRGKYKLEE